MHYFTDLCSSYKESENWLNRIPQTPLREWYPLALSILFAHLSGFQYRIRTSAQVIVRGCSTRCGTEDVQSGSPVASLKCNSSCGRALSWIGTTFPFWFPQLKYLLPVPTAFCSVGWNREKWRDLHRGFSPTPAKARSLPHFYSWNETC